MHPRQAQVILALVRAPSARRVWAGCALGLAPARGHSSAGVHAPAFVCAWAGVILPFGSRWITACREHVQPRTALRPKAGWYVVW